MVQARLLSFSWNFSSLILSGGTEPIPLNRWERGMAETTKDKLRANAARRLDLRDVVGAWLVCGLVAAIALAVSGDFHAPPAFPPVAIALVQPMPGNGEIPLTARIMT